MRWRNKGGNLMRYHIRDWNKYKHFKDRNAPWVKLNKDLLNDRDWFELPADTAKTLVMLWLVASEDPEREGNLPDERELAFRLRMNVAEIHDHMGKLEKWLEKTSEQVDQTETPMTQNDNNTITEQADTYTTKATSSKKSTKKKPAGKKKYDKHSYNKEFEKFWALYPKKVLKGSAYKKYLQITETVPATEIIAGLQRQLEDSHFTEDPKHFTFAETWLNQRRWDLEAPE